MVETILANLYRIEIPLPQNPLRSLNSYVIKGPDRNLIIDTGMNRPECLQAMMTGLQEIGVELKTTDLFITHMHVDHLGLAPTLAADARKVYFNALDAGRVIINDPDAIRDYFARTALLHGFPEEELQEALDEHPGFKYAMKTAPRFTFMKDGDRLSIAGYDFTCIQTPGHSFGHLCLYEPARKLLISGDHMLGDITPNIQTWFDGWNPLKLYLESLDKVKGLDIALVLPGHRGLITDASARIEELKQHHEQRGSEVLSMLAAGSRTAYEVASRMTWDIACDSFDLFPVVQKWFAVGEAIAHLVFLEQMGMIYRETTDGRIRFFLRSRT